ncbi:MAG: hypothetical protein R2744_01070 [Bacteroidales bacterium]
MKKYLILISLLLLHPQQVGGVHNENAMNIAREQSTLKHTRISLEAENLNAQRASLKSNFSPASPFEYSHEREFLDFVSDTGIPGERRLWVIYRIPARSGNRCKVISTFDYPWQNSYSEY